MTESSSLPPAKRLKVSSSSSTCCSSSFPTSIVTWNCNGFIPRCKYNFNDMKHMLEETDQPDMICIQEARIQASSKNNRGTPALASSSSEYQKGGGPVVEKVLNSNIFRNYTPYWSLADTRYAGTLTLIHQRIISKNKQPIEVRYSFDSAIDWLLQQYQQTRDQHQFRRIDDDDNDDDNDHNHDTTTRPKLSTKKQQQRQTSIHSFFKATSTTSPSKEHRKQQQQQPCRHHKEGRFQYFAFTGLDIMQTYVPNHGTKPEQWERRKRWDLQMEEFLQQRRTIAANRPLLWCGDLNVAHMYADGTHWKRIPLTKDGSLRTSSSRIYEWWTDERKCMSFSNNNNNNHKDPQFVGMPSFTPIERSRFTKLLQVGQFVDVWRKLHPTTTTTDSIPNWDKDPYWTWK
eukprot:scaffold6219_cov146-Cylindrotheca_fusiformis.AAC.1